MSRTIGPWLALLILIAAVSTLGISRLDREISFYDEGVYVVNAKSLATGEGFRNVSLPGSPPQGKYPPFFPFLLSVIWRVLPEFPSNLLALKASVLLMGVCLLGVAYSYLRRCRQLNGPDSVAVVALIGLNPFFLFYATHATSDIPYALMSLVALYLYERSVLDHRTVIFGLMLLVALLAFFTRTAGIFLLIAIVADLTRQRRVRPAIVAAMTSALGVATWTTWSWWATAAYGQFAEGVRENYVGYSASISVTDSIGQLPQIVTVNLRLLLQGWQLFLFPWLPAIAGVLLFPIAYFFFRHVKPRLRLEELYCALYLIGILVIPYPDTARYFLAIAPLLIAFVVAGLRSLVCQEICKSRPEGRARRMADLIVGGLTLATLVADISASAHHVQQRTIGIAEFHRTLDWIDQNVPSDGILIGDYDPAYYLYTGRKAIRLSTNVRVWYSNEDPRNFPRADALLESFQRLRACYIIKDPLIGGPEGVYYRNLVDWLRETSRPPLVHLYENLSAGYAVYEQSGCP